MKKLLLMALLLMAANAHAAPKNSCIRYQKDHFFYHRGEEMNVIDVDLEWPEYVDGFHVKNLQAYLAGMLFGSQGEFSGFEKSYAAFLQRFGDPVVQQFKTIPDDRKFCYVEVSLRQKGHLANRYISYELSYRCAPERLSTQRGDTVRHYITYDLQQQRVLRMKDLIRTQRLENGYYGAGMLLELARNASIDFGDDMLGITFLDGYLADSDLCFDMLYMTEREYVPFTTRLSAKNYRSLFTKEARGILEKEAAPGPVATVPKNSLWQGEPIYNKVDKAPEFRGGGERLAAFLKENVNYPAEVAARKVGGTVMVEFVIAKTGEVGNVKVVSPVDPALDREAVRVVKLMPKWTPGELKGERVATTLDLPLGFRPE